MIELIFAVCMVDQPSRCKDVRLTFEPTAVIKDTVDPGQCFSNGQMAMAQWSGENPNWVIKKWRCEVAGQVAKI